CAVSPAACATLAASRSWRTSLRSRAAGYHGRMAPVSWKLIQHGWPVFSSDGQQIGLVFLVVGDEDADILDGLAVTHHRGFAFHNFVDRPHYLEASKVAAIDDGGRVTASISAA